MPKQSGSGRLESGAYPSGRLDLHSSQSGRLDLGRYQSGRSVLERPCYNACMLYIMLCCGVAAAGVLTCAAVACRVHEGDLPPPPGGPGKDLRPKASSHFPPAAPLRTASTALQAAPSAKARCAGWRNPQQWLMLAMSLLAMFIFAVRIYQSRHVSALQGPQSPLHCLPLSVASPKQTNVCLFHCS